MRNNKFEYWGLLFMILVLSFGCSKKGEKSKGDDSSEDKGNDNDTDRIEDTSVDDTIIDSDIKNGDNNFIPGDPICENTFVETQLSPVYLAVAFDVSGSMGHMDHPYWWHDPVTKWTPVVEVLSAFFSNAGSEGIFASMTLFPSLGNRDTKCNLDTYLTPDIPMTPLPSSGFQSVFEDYEDEVGATLEGGNWRGGTPTLAVFEGITRYLEEVVFDSEQRDEKFAIIIVTDGLPQGCPGQDEISLVSSAISSYYAETQIPTYVIGIENPSTPPDQMPDFWPNWGCGDENTEPCSPPDTLDDLNEFAQAGGTEAAFLIDTGNPDATREKFTDAIDLIRKKTISCILEIPPHPVEGMTFEEEKINVSMMVDDEITSFAYDPECTKPLGWRFNGSEESIAIELCSDTCDLVQSDSGAALNVNFLCEPRIEIL